MFFDGDDDSFFGDGGEDLFVCVNWYWYCTAQVTSSTNSYIISPITVDILLLKPIAVRPGDVDENQYFLFTMRMFIFMRLTFILIFKLTN